MRSNASWKYAVTNAISAFRLITQHLTNTVIFIARCMAAFHAGSQFVIAIFYFCSSSEDSAATPSIRMDKSGLWRFIGRSSHIFRCRSIRAVGITSVSGGALWGQQAAGRILCKAPFALHPAGNKRPVCRPCGGYPQRRGRPLCPKLRCAHGAAHAARPLRFHAHFLPSCAACPQGRGRRCAEGSPAACALCAGTARRGTV